MTLLEGRNRFYLLVALLAVAVVVAVGWAAWVGAEESATEPQNAGINVNMQVAADGEAPYDGPSGIWVSGHGKASGTPDTAVISLGVESVEDTAAAARANAAAAMKGVTDVLTKAGVAEADIQTRHFNISPRYQSVEVERCDEAAGQSSGSAEGDAAETRISKESCYFVWESRLIGYSVSNQASVTIRDLDDVGTIIDKGSEAAGDLVRINGIRFDIDDPSVLAGRGEGKRGGGYDAPGGIAGQPVGGEAGPTGVHHGGSFVFSAAAPLCQGRSGGLRRRGRCHFYLTGGTGCFRFRAGGVPDSGRGGIGEQLR